MLDFLRPVLIVVFTIFQLSQVVGQDWQTLYDETLEYYDQGSYDNSIQKGKEALKVAESDIEKLFTLKILSTSASESGRYEEGIEYGMQEVNLCNSLLVPDSVMYNSLHTLGINLLSIEDYDNAKTYLKRSSLSAFNHYGESSYEYNLSLSELGLSYYMLDSMDSAIYCLEAANSKLIEIPDGGIDFLNNAYLIGLIYFEQEKLPQARSSYIDLKEVLELNEFQSELIYAETCENLGTIHYNLQEFELAESTLAASLSSYMGLGYEVSDLSVLINTLALTYLKINQKEKSDSLLALIEPSDQSQNVIINQINLASTNYLKKEYQESREIVNELQSKLDPDADKSLLAEVFLLQTKLDDADGIISAPDKINYCLETFAADNNYERLIEAYLFQSRMLVQQLDFTAANNSIKEGFLILDAHPVSQDIKYMIIRESISLYLRQGSPTEANITYQMISSKGYLDKSHKEDLLNDYAQLLQIYGYMFESSLMFDQLVEVSEYPRQPEYHLSLVKSLIRQSIYTQAKFELDKLQSSALENGIDENSEIFAEIYSLNAKVYLNEGDYSNAEVGFRNSIKILDNKNIHNDPLKADIYNSAAIFYQTIGNYEEALNFYAQAEEFSEDESSLSIDILQNIATLKQIIGDYPESIMILESALEGYEKIYGKDHPAYATSLQNLATAYQKSGNPEKALPYLEEALRIDEENNLNGTVSHTTKHHNLAVLYQELDMLEKSESNFREVVQMRKDILSENHPDYAFSLYNLAVVLQRMKKNSEAREVFNEAIDKYKILVKDFFPYLSEKEKSAFYGKINGAFTAWKDFTAEYAEDNPASAGELYDFQLSNKAVLLNSSVDLRSKIALTADQNAIRLFDEWLALKEEAVKLLTLSEEDLRLSGKSVVDLQKKANDLEKELSLKSENFNSARSNEEISWKNIRDNLKEGDAAVEIFRIRKNIKNDSVWYVALIVKPDQIEYPEIEIFNNGLELENKWFKYYSNSIKFKLTDSESMSKFWAPIEKHLDGIETIYVSPDGIFNKVSLNTLYNPQSQKYLLEKYRIHYLSNNRDLLTLGEDAQELDKKIHLYGNPEFNLAGDGTGIKGTEIAPLPGTALEIASIQSVLEETNWQISANTEASASESNIKQNDHSGAIHIATHGIFLEDSDPDNDFYSLENNPLMRSGLLLAGSENTFTGNRIVVNTSVDGEDGVLTAYEVMNMDLSKTDLVILSACETGLGEIKNGEGVYGLQRAFSIAGANTLIISLWKVNDEATKDLMISFYRYYSEGKNKFDAISLAQRDMLVKYKDPYFWGAFVMSGI